MNNLKKIGLSALAGSLVATSAFAGEMAVGGSAKATFTDRETGTITGNQIGMNKGLTFTGSGDLDSGHSIKFYTALNGTSRSSSSLTYDMGDMGSLTLDNGVGGHGIGSIDDKTPTANEEIWDNITNATESYLVGIGNNGALAYSNTFGGITLSADYVKQGGGALEDGATGAAGSDGSDGSDFTSDAELNAISGLTSAEDKGIRFTGSGTAEVITITDAATTILDDANVAAIATTLGLGTGSSPQFTGVNVGHATDTTVTRASGGDLNIEGNIVYRAGGTDVPIADGGTGASTVAAAKVALELDPFLGQLTGKALVFGL